MSIENPTTEINSVAQEQIDRIAEKCAKIKPLVAINCITYNHEAYLRDALESFVMQKTDFPFVAIVHDDASTDGTADIIREYAARYPDIILPIYETENQYSKRDGSLGRTMHKARNATGAKYIAYCEGDDYWTKPQKLQMQVDYLEAHPDYTMCFHNALEHKENRDVPDKSFSNLENGDYTGLEMYSHWIVPTASVVVRHSIFDSEIYHKTKESRRFVFGDILLFLSATHCGKAYAMAETMSVYRRHEGGVTALHSIKRDLQIIEHQKEIVRVFGPEYDSIAKRHISELYLSIRDKYRKEGNKRKALLSILASMRYDVAPALAIMMRKLKSFYKNE